MVLGFGGTLIAAPPKCDSLFPAGGQRGKEVVVTAAGSFSNWPATTWVDRKGITVEPESDKGKLKVTIAGDAHGVYLIRLHDKEGATQLRSFVVDSLPEVAEVEPNNELSAAQKLEQSSIVNGRLEKSGDVDGFRIGLKAGQTLVASMTANQVLGSPMDAVLQLCSGDGFVLVQNDDERGVDPQITFTATHDSDYVVRAFAFPITPNSTIGFSGAASYIYRLTLTTGGFVDHAIPVAAASAGSTDVALFGWNLPESSIVTLPIASKHDRVFAASDKFASSASYVASSHPAVIAPPSSSREKPQLIEWPATITSRIDKSNEEDVYQVTATKGTKLAIQVESDSLGYRLDPMIQFVAEDGKVIGEVDDTSRKRDCLLTQTIPADGTYRIVIRDVHRDGGLRYVYRATIAEAKPEFALTLASDSFVLTPGKPLEIPVAIERKNGFSEVIDVTAIDLPAGVSTEVVKSESKGDTSKSVKLILKAETGQTGPVSGTLQIVGTSASDTSMTRTASYAIGSTNERFHLAWLTVGSAGADK